MRVCINLPEDLLSKIDKYSKAAYKSRSAYITESCLWRVSYDAEHFPEPDTNWEQICLTPDQDA